MGVETLVTTLPLQEVYKKSTRKLQESLIKTCGLLGGFKRNHYLSCVPLVASDQRSSGTRWWVIIRLVTLHRVFFDKRSGKAERIEQFITERGIEYGLQFVTPFFLNSLDCLYLKKGVCTVLKAQQAMHNNRYTSRTGFLCQNDHYQPLMSQKTTSP